MLREGLPIWCMSSVVFNHDTKTAITIIGSQEGVTTREGERLQKWACHRRINSFRSRGAICELPSVFTLFEFKTRITSISCLCSDEETIFINHDGPVELRRNSHLSDFQPIRCDFFFSREAIEKTLLKGSQILFVFVRGCNNLPERKKCFFLFFFLTFQQQ